MKNEKETVVVVVVVVVVCLFVCLFVCCFCCCFLVDLLSLFQCLEDKNRFDKHIKKAGGVVGKGRKAETQFIID